MIRMMDGYRIHKEVLRSVISPEAHLSEPSVVYTNYMVRLVSQWSSVLGCLVRRYA